MIQSSGSIITEDFCIELANDGKSKFTSAASFGIDTRNIDAHIAEIFAELRERWEKIRVEIKNNSLDNNQLRTKWQIPFLKAMGFEPVYLPANQKSNSNLEYYISHKGSDDEYSPYIHLINTNKEFDQKDIEHRTHSNKSPHDMLQQFLNTSQHQWAVLFNGRKIRILRDFFHSITKGFLQFDVEEIFETAKTEQFRLMFKILHASRFVNQHQSIEDKCILEEFHEKSRETGVKIGNKLRRQVIFAIETLGNGFAENLNPDEFNDARTRNFYTQLLNIIYRLLFLLFAEQKGWLPVQNETYAKTYSIAALRNLSAKSNFAQNEFTDLWEGLKITFGLVTKGFQFPDGKKINAFGGQLFSDEKIEIIADLSLKNKFLLQAIYALSFFEDNKLLQKINYTTLEIDELGSVYESLLDYNPVFFKENTEIGEKTWYSGQFLLDDRSTDRKTSGSYYTDSRLVAQLVDSALVPVIENAVRNKTSLQDKEQAILELKIADIACGSGAFLIAALRKTGEYLANIRVGENQQPTEEQYRKAMHDVLLNCIYGVDLNPMAVELAKFSLWITAAMPDMPLSFLDHKIKCGNSLVGATPQLIENGIPPEAYDAVTLDNKDICKQLKEIVRKELKEIKHGAVQTSMYFVTNIINTEQEALEYLELIKNQQATATEVERTEKRYRTIYNSLKEQTNWRLADTWTAAFFIRKDDINKQYPTNQTLRKLREGAEIDENLIDEIEQLSSEYRFFHFHLEFPEVFNRHNSGFDCILGNPPWEKINLEDKEFFATKRPDISEITKSETRTKKINELKISDINLFNEYVNAVDFTNKSINFYKNSNSYLYGNVGLLNTYPLFTEKVVHITNNLSAIGYIIPSGFFADDTLSSNSV